jgi:hypothetical protein
LEDEGGVVTRQLGSGKAPEAVLISPKGWSARYRGRIADVVPGSSGSQPWLASALDSVLADQRVVVKQTESTGGVIPSVSYADRTYSGHIAPLLQAKCVHCHSPGNIAPWSMTNHAAVKEFAPAIKDSAMTRRMPPWHADPRQPAFANSQMLEPDELATLVDWVDRGAPRGGGPDPLEEQSAPPPVDWPLGRPDKIVAIAPQTIPASGTVDYRYLVMPSPYTSDVWLRAATVKAGNRKVLHHVLVFSGTSFADVLQVQAGLGGYFAAFVPGQEQIAFPDGTGKLLKRGSFLVFQVHYTATGKDEIDATELGLYAAATPPSGELRTAAAYNIGFNIPAGASEHSVSAEYAVTQEILLHELSPHMHYRGKHFKFEVVAANGTRETILNVPFYRFDWQSLYRLAEPKRIPAGSRIVCSGGWDNSELNAWNPDPSVNVKFGEQSWEEMFIGYFNYSIPR